MSKPATSDSLTQLANAAALVLKCRGETIAVSESSMGGLVSAALVAVPGASSYFLGGATIYTHQSRKQLLGMDEASLKGIRPATEEYALLCAHAMHKRLGATWTLAETGATGPDANPYMDPPGTAWIAIVGQPKTSPLASGLIEKTLRIETNSSHREANMWVFAQQALDFVTETID